jgi:hypothetical protein
VGHGRRQQRGRSALLSSRRRPRRPGPRCSPARCGSRPLSSRSRAWPRARRRPAGCSQPPGCPRPAWCAPWRRACSSRCVGVAPGPLLEACGGVGKGRCSHGVSLPRGAACARVAASTRGSQPPPLPPALPPVRPRAWGEGRVRRWPVLCGWPLARPWRQALPCSRRELSACAGRAAPCHFFHPLLPPPLPPPMPPSPPHMPHLSCAGRQPRC